MKQEPVAWSCWNEGMPCAVILVTEPDMYEWQSIKPLYTAPRDLSDEEIENKVKTIPHKNGTDYAVGFYEGAKWAVEAILKKASEK